MAFAPDLAVHTASHLLRPVELGSASIRSPSLPESEIEKKQAETKTKTHTHTHTHICWGCSRRRALIAPSQVLAAIYNKSLTRVLGLQKCLEFREAGSSARAV